MEGRFRYIEEGPSADLTVEAYGPTLAEAFASAALAMFNAMTPLEKVEKRVTRALEVGGDDLGGLLYNFLDELLFVHEAELIVFSGIDVALDEENLQATAECSGEPFDLGRHEQGTAIKAITFHQMRIERRDGGWAIRVVFDT